MGMSEKVLFRLQPELDQLSYHLAREGRCNGGGGVKLMTNYIQGEVEKMALEFVSWRMGRKLVVSGVMLEIIRGAGRLSDRGA